MFRSSSSVDSKVRWGQPLDQASLLVMAMLSIAILALLVLGNRTAPRIRNFSWQDKQIGAEDIAFTLTFSRPMNKQSVVDNLQVNVLIPDSEPRPVPGKISWAGQKMAYTLEDPAPYGYEFELALKNAQDRFSQTGKRQATIEPFTSTFRTRDRAFFYLGVEGEEEGRLVMYNLTQNHKQILTPSNLVVFDYESYPKGDRVVFSATERESHQEGILDQKLYTIATGLEVQDASEPILANRGLKGSLNAIATGPPSETNQPETPILLLDSDRYQNLKFDLAPDGQSLVIYRVRRDDPSDFGLWILRSNQDAIPLETEPGGDFLITPDSQSLAYLQGEGLAILPLEPDANMNESIEPLDFLPQYGMVLNFSNDGSKAAMVQFRSEGNVPTRSLFLVTNQGAEKELLETNGNILDAQFDPRGKYLYCLVTKLQSADTFLEQPFLMAIDLETAEQTRLLLLPQQQNIKMSIAPDGLGILFDQVKSTADPNLSDAILRGNDGSAITASQLWFFPLTFDKQEQLVLAEPDSIPVEGLHPHWVP
ncbi:MAG: hypothetical protein AAGD25_00370 [Cyanobacteria bacterium P01_F01_bin.150]